MPTIDIKNWDNKKVGSVDLPEAIPPVRPARRITPASMQRP